MPVRIIGETAGPGWGCSCKSFKLSEPTPERALAALVRSAAVTVEVLNKNPDGSIDFRAWTKEANKYSVAYDPHRAGGFCKHCVACSRHVTGDWIQQAALGAKILQEKKREKPD